MSSVMVVIQFWTLRHSADWPISELTLNSQDFITFKKKPFLIPWISFLLSPPVRLSVGIMVSSLTTCPTGSAPQSM